MHRHAELAHNKDVHRDLKAAGNFVGDRHTTTRKREHDYIIAAGIFLQQFREVGTSVVPVPKKLCPGFEHNQSPLLKTGRKCVWQLALLPAGIAIEWFDGATFIEMNDGIELFGDFGGKVVAVTFGFRSIDHADRPFEKR